MAKPGLGEVFDLTNTYLSLDGQGRVVLHPVDDAFWETIDSNTSILGSLVGIYTSEADWPHWEMHPAGEEILIMIEGMMTLILDRNGKETRVPFAAGETLIVPRGTWHRALVARPSKFIGITYGAGTEQRPV